MNSDLQNCDQPADKLGKLLRGETRFQHCWDERPRCSAVPTTMRVGFSGTAGGATFEFQKSKMANSRNYAFSGTQKIGGWPPGKHLRQFLIQGGFFRGLEQYVLSRKQLEIETRLL